MALLLAGISCGLSAWTGGRFGDLPPAYHDEFSYQFQAKTFLAGRLSFPSFAPMPELFDQMHVLNEGRFASRYFPGAGLWLAPFVNRTFSPKRDLFPAGTWGGVSIAVK